MLIVNQGDIAGTSIFYKRSLKIAEANCYVLCFYFKFDDFPVIPALKKCLGSIAHPDTKDEVAEETAPQKVEKKQAEPLAPVKQE